MLVIYSLSDADRRKDNDERLEMKWDDDSLLNAHVIYRGEEHAASLVRYVASVVKRERERLAQIVRSAGVDPSVADAILSDEADADTFRWGASVGAIGQRCSSRAKAA